LGILGTDHRYLGWMTDKVTPAVILIVSVAAVGYFLLQAPLCSGSATRDGILRRNNS